MTKEEILARLDLIQVAIDEVNLSIDPDLQAAKAADLVSDLRNELKKEVILTPSFNPFGGSPTKR